MAPRTPLIRRTAAEPGYTFALAAQILEIPESRLRYWSQIGFVGPSQRRGGQASYAFHDLVNVKAAKELLDRGFSAAEIRKALESIRSSLPTVQQPLRKLRVGYDGHGLVVTDDGVAFEPSGQRVFDFGLADLAARAEAFSPSAVGGSAGGQAGGSSAESAQAPQVGKKPGPPDASAPTRNAYEWLTEGLRLEAAAPAGEAAAAHAQAESCYRRALELDPGLAAAHTNLAVLFHRRGQLVAARAAFEAALALDPDQPEARYDLAVLLVQDNEPELAASELRRVLQARPDFADAHYNLATVLERLGGRRQSREHLLRFLDLAVVADVNGENSAAAAEALAPWLEEARARVARL